MYIAVCDDQTEELKDLTELLGAWETDRGTPVRVKSFRSAAALLDAARHERFTLYLLDIMMPGLNGMDAAREIRGFDKAADIIFLTSSPGFAYDSYSVKALEYLLNKYKNFVRSRARSYFLIGADHEDIVQEGMIGLYKAIRDYRSEKLSSFRAFAELCVTRQIITAIKTATRQKHIPLNSYVSLNKPIYDDENERTLIDVISEELAANPEELLISREDISLIEGRIGDTLSPLEKQVLLRYLDGKSYQDISAELGRHVKSIDNALQRVKRKLQKLLLEQHRE